MLIALIARDKPEALEVRKANREAHLAYLNASGEMIAQAGPLLENEAMIGSLIILSVETMAEAEAWAAQDPYAIAGLFASVELIHWNRVIGG